jgi:hypothetical protein
MRRAISIVACRKMASELKGLVTLVKTCPLLLALLA